MPSTGNLFPAPRVFLCIDHTEVRALADVARFDEFYQGSRQRLLGYVFLLTGDLAEAQDVVQEAYMRAWQHWSTIHGYDDPEAWMRTVASRIAVSRWRRIRGRARAYLRHGPADPVPAPSLNTVAVVEALRRIPARRTAGVAPAEKLPMVSGRSGSTREWQCWGSPVIGR